MLRLRVALAKIQVGINMKFNTAILIISFLLNPIYSILGKGDDLNVKLVAEKIKGYCATNKIITEGQTVKGSRIAKSVEKDMKQYLRIGKIFRLPSGCYFDFSSVTEIPVSRVFILKCSLKVITAKSGEDVAFEDIGEFILSPKKKLEAMESFEKKIRDSGQKYKITAEFRISENIQLWREFCEGDDTVLKIHADLLQWKLLE